VFIHSGWRTAGTWIWSEFRSNPATMAFYEPLHEELAGLTLSQLADINTESWDSGHPQTAPYFVEYAPLLNGKRRGVAGFERSFAFSDYFVDADSQQPKLFAYLTRLSNLAFASGRKPVFKFCRSLGRTAWMKHHFPDAAHVTLVRDPITQWESAWRLSEQGTPYFLAMPAAVLARSAGIPVVDAVTAAFELRLGHLSGKHDPAADERCAEFARNATMAMTYRVSLAYWLVTSLVSLANAELAIDSDLLGTSSRYREETQDALTRVTGIDVNLGSARVSRRHGLQPASNSEITELHGLARAIAAANGAPAVLSAKL
jgi:hypothetical protein